MEEALSISELTELSTNLCELRVQSRLTERAATEVTDYICKTVPRQELLCDLMLVVKAHTDRQMLKRMRLEDQKFKADMYFAFKGWRDSFIGKMLAEQL